MPREVFRTGRAELRRLAEEFGLDPDNLTKVQLRRLETEHNNRASRLHLHNTDLRRAAASEGLNPNDVSRSDISHLMHSERRRSSKT